MSCEGDPTNNITSKISMKCQPVYQFKKSIKIKFQEIPSKYVRMVKLYAIMISGKYFILVTLQNVALE